MELRCQSFATVLTRFTKVYLVRAACTFIYLFVYLFSTTVDTSGLRLKPQLDAVSETSSKSIQSQSK